MDSTPTAPPTSRSPATSSDSRYSSYSWYQVVTDGPVTAPRWIHHIAIKLCTQHTATSFLLLVVSSLLPGGPRPILASLIGGPLVYAGIITKKLWHHARPNWPDWIHDGALAFAPFAGGLILGGDQVGGALLLGACVATWRQLHRRAIP